MLDSHKERKNECLNIKCSQKECPVRVILFEKIIELEKENKEIRSVNAWMRGCLNRSPPK